MSPPSRIPHEYKPICFFILYTAFFLTFLQANAQEKRTPDLSQLHVGTGYMPVIHFSPENSDYSTASFVRVTLGINYLKGYIRFNSQYTSFSSMKQPECRMLDNSLSYLRYIRLYKGTYIYAGGQLGLNTINFRGDSISSGREYETEISAGLEAGVEVRILPKLGLSCSYKLQRIFATPRNTLSAMDVGIVYYFNSNEKLRQWLE